MNGPVDFTDPMCEPVQPAASRTPYRDSHGKLTMVLYTRPGDCGGHCLYCFRVPGVTKSTTRNEDTLLGRSSDWRPSVQFARRAARYRLVPASGIKFDVALKGDSFTTYSPGYLRSYMKDLYDYVNGFESSTLAEAIVRQADAGDRCATVKCETRPDRIDEAVCELLGELGVTTVEIGVQSLDEGVLERIRRGHDTGAVRRATALLKGHGFEVVYQMMAGLPGSNAELDEHVLTEVLWRPEYAPDALKLYPCLLLHESVARHEGLTETFESGEWTPLRDAEYKSLLDRVLPRLPPWTHLNRLQRLIPTNEVRGGPSSLVERSEFANASRCLWQRSVAQRWTNPDDTFAELAYEVHRQGEDGWCVVAVARGDTVVGYGRLGRTASGQAVLRDVRVLGSMRSVGECAPEGRGCQHRGVGRALVARMEAIARSQGVATVWVRPSPGTPRWFEGLGYVPRTRRVLVKELGDGV